MTSSVVRRWPWVGGGADSWPIVGSIRCRSQARARPTTPPSANHFLFWSCRTRRCAHPHRHPLRPTRATRLTRVTRAAACGSSDSVRSAPFAVMSEFVAWLAAADDTLRDRQHRHAAARAPRPTRFRAVTASAEGGQVTSRRHPRRAVTDNPRRRPGSEVSAPLLAEAQRKVTCWSAARHL